MIVALTPVRVVQRARILVTGVLVLTRIHATALVAKGCVTRLIPAVGSVGAYQNQVFVADYDLIIVLPLT
jgi:hypothetical protein